MANGRNSGPTKETVHDADIDFHSKCHERFGEIQDLSYSATFCVKESILLRRPWRRPRRLLFLVGFPFIALLIKQRMRDDSRRNPIVQGHLKQENAYVQAIMANTVDIQNQLYLQMKERVEEEELSAPLRLSPFAS